MPPIKPVEITSRTLETNDFVVYQGSQPGYYNVDVWFGGRPVGEEGVLWLRATDRTMGERISVDRVEGATRRSVRGDGGGFVYYPGADDTIRIEAGTWGDPYPVVFDLVYQPNGNSPDVVLSKTYLIEGWTR